MNEVSKRGFTPVKNMIVRHFKGGVYKVLEVAKHTETGDYLVIYQNMDDATQIFARPYEMFCSLVDKSKYPEAKQEYRLEPIAMLSDVIQNPEYIVSRFDDLVEEAKKLGTPIRYNTELEEDLVLYYNKYYDKILVDKSFIKMEEI